MTNDDANGNRNGHGTARIAREGLTTSWLASRLGLQSAHVDAMRRNGDLLGVRVPRGQEHVFPAWQFDRDGKTLASVPRLIRTARASGIGDDALYRLLDMRTGLTSGRRVADELRAGNDGPALRAIETAGAAP